MPLLSIVIPTYNRSFDLKRAIDSILSQTYKNWEVVIVDNHSKDNTDEVIKNFQDSRIRLYKIHNNGVIAASRNLGIKYSNGEYIAFLDSDDWWHSSKLEKSLEALNNGADLVYHDLWRAHSHKVSAFVKKVKTRKLRSPIFSDLLLNGNGITNSSVVIKKSILIKVGNISEDLNLIAWEDFDYWLRISQVTEKFTRIPHCLGYYWVGGGNVSNPLKTLTILNEIQNRYDGFFEASYAKGFSPSWIHYGILTSLIETGQFKIKGFSHVLKKMNVKDKLKIAIKLILTNRSKILVL